MDDDEIAKARGEMEVAMVTAMEDHYAKVIWGDGTLPENLVGLASFLPDDDAPGEPLPRRFWLELALEDFRSGFRYLWRAIRG